MATIKSYTDIKQSETLVNILPLESADAKYGYIAPYEYSDRMYDAGYDEIPYPIAFIKKDYSNFFAEEYDGELPCWSLAALLDALLDVLPSATLDSSSDHHFRIHCMERDTEWYDNAVDACYEMIICLNELKLLQL